MSETTLEASWHSYPKVWAIGHAGVAELFFDEVHIEEKVLANLCERVPSFGHCDCVAALTKQS